MFLLSSRTDPLVIAFLIGPRSSNEALPVSHADPEPLLLHLDEQPTHAGWPPSTLVCRGLQYRRIRQHLGSAAVPGLFKLFVLTNDLHITEHLYQSLDTSFSIPIDSPLSTVIPLPGTGGLYDKSSKYADIDELDDFVVYEDIERADLDRTESAVISHDQGAAVKSDDVSLLDWEDVYEVINGSSADPDRVDEEADGIEFAECLAKVELALKDSDNFGNRSASIADFLTVPLRVGQVEEDSEKLTKLLERLKEEGKLDLHFGTLSTRGRADAKHKTIADVYSQISDLFLSRVHGPDHNRLAKAQILAKSIAAELVLASISVRRKALPPTITETGADPRTPLSSSPSLFAQQGPSSQQPDFHSSPPQVPPPWEMSEEDPACQRLRAYTEVTKPIPPISSSHELSDILAHLPTDPRADPRDYDWRSTELKIAAARGDEALAKADPKARRKAERLARAQKKRMELQRKALDEMRQEEAPPMIMSSQAVMSRPTPQGPGLGIPEPLSSQVLLMSQPERGVFGTRKGAASKGKRDKGKKRIAGF